MSTDHSRGYNLKKLMIDKTDFILFITIFLVVFSVYIRYMAPSILPGDPAEFAIVSFVLGIPHPSSYPIYTWIGHVFTFIPLGNVAFRINIMSGFFGALTAALIYNVILKINIKIYEDTPSLNRVIAIIMAFALAFSKTFWFQSESAEVYTLSSFFLVLMIYLLIKWTDNKDSKFLYLFSLIFGLSLGAHISNILFAPAFIVFILLNDYKIVTKKKDIFLMMLLFCLGTSQFLYILWRSTQNPEFNHIGQIDIYGLIDVISGKKFGAGTYHPPLTQIPNILYDYLPFIKMNFNLWPLIGIIGIWQLFKRNIKIFILIGSLSAIFMMYYVYYIKFVAIDLDLEVMLIPSFILLSIFIGVGICSIIHYIKCKMEEQKFSINHPLLKNIILMLIVILFISMPFSFFSQNLNQNDQSKNNGKAIFYQESLESIPSDSIVIADWADFTSFRYFQIVDQLNPSINIIFLEEDELWVKTINETIDNKKVFLVNNKSDVLKNYNLKPFFVSNQTILYQVEKR
jgi:hypothetical protein